MYSLNRKANSGASSPINTNSNLNNNIAFSSLRAKNVVNIPNTTLNPLQEKKYVELLNYLQGTKPTLNSQRVSPQKQLDILLKNGKLLNKSSHDGSTTLDNLYDIASQKRTKGIDNKNVLLSTLDLLVNPKLVTQTFGDIPNNAQDKILSILPDSDEIKANPETMNVYASGTCAAASIEVNMADKYPSEFARWVSKLSSEDKSVQLNVKMSSLSKNVLAATDILKLLEADVVKYRLDSAVVNVKPDDNAYIRAGIQNSNWDNGERTIPDVLIQSAIMNLGSQNTYNSLNDVRAGKFNSNPQGLIELEKTFVESLIKNKETTSLVYQQIDDNQNLVGYNCSFDMIQKHITDTIDSGDDVILGYVLTNETAGVTSSSDYNKANDGDPNKVINGHEITVIDYQKDKKGNVEFICVDTDDDSPELVKYSADWLLPKIHHAGYPASIVAKDEDMIMQSVA